MHVLYVHGARKTTQFLRFFYYRPFSMILAPVLKRVMVTARSKKNVAQMSRSIDVLLYSGPMAIRVFLLCIKAK